MPEHFVEAIDQLGQRGDTGRRLGKVPPGYSEFLKKILIVPAGPRLERRVPALQDALHPCLVSIVWRNRSAWVDQHRYAWLRLFGQQIGRGSQHEHSKRLQ